MVPTPSDIVGITGVIQVKHLEYLKQAKCSINATWYNIEKNIIIVICTMIMETLIIFKFDAMEKFL